MAAQILWIGTETNGSKRAEFSPIFDELAETYAVRFASDIAEVKTAAIDLVIFAVSRPGEFPIHEVKSLQARSPDSKFVYVLGDWSCGQKRTESEFSRVETFYCHELQHGSVYAQLVGESTNPYPLAHTSASTAATDFVAVYARTRSFGEAVQDMVASFTAKVVQLEFGDQVATEGVNVVLWETPMEGFHRESQLAEIKARHPESQVIALVDYPRAYEIEELGKAGVHVVSKPFRESDLLRQIRAACDSGHQLRFRISA